MIQRCARCGNWVRPEVEVRSFHPIWGDIVQHRRCKDIFKGTATHYLHNPDPEVVGEAFTSKDEHGNYSIFNVVAIKRDLCVRPKREVILANMSLEVSKRIVEQNEVDEEDAYQIMQARRAEGTLFDPIILVERPDGQNFAIDGSHRIAIAYFTGREVIPAWVVKKAETDPYREDNWDPKLSEFFAVQR